MSRSLTVGCSLSSLQLDTKSRTSERILKEILKVLDEDVVKTVQLYPAAWPRQLKLTVTEMKNKDEILKGGLTLFDRHVEFEDSDDLITKIIVKDAGSEWDDEKLTELLSDYANIVRSEKEKIYIDGRRTSIESGTRYFYASKIMTRIPTKIFFEHSNKSFPISVWYKGQNEASSNDMIRCGYCGEDHKTANCGYGESVCFTCKEPGHNRGNCVNNVGAKVSQKCFVVTNSRCPLSNWNQEYTFKVDGTEYSCIEQYITEEKAYNFGDTKAAQDVRQETDPRVMRRIGENIKGYNHREWNSVADAVMLKALVSKFTDPGARGAQETLMKTGNKVIGFAGKNDYWGVGLQSNEPGILDENNWPGSNILGKMLMEIRSKAEKSNSRPSSRRATHEISSSGEEDDDSSPDTSFTNAMTNAASGEVTKWTLVVGDSNTPHDIEDLVDEFPTQVKSLAKPGMKVEQVRDVINKCMIPKDDVEHVILNVGTCQWHFEEDVVSGEKVYKDILKSLNDISKVYPKTSFVISGVPLRDPVGATAAKSNEINEEIKDLNSRIHDLALENDNITYANNENITITSKTPPGTVTFYRPGDSIHLNEDGSIKLLDNLRKGLAESIAKSLVRWENV